MWTLSTAHIRRSTAYYLEDQADGTSEADLSVYQKSEFGWLIAVDPSYPNDEDIHIPEELANILKTAASMGCEWVCLDADGSRVEDLPIYDWSEEDNDE